MIATGGAFDSQYVELLIALYLALERVSDEVVWKSVNDLTCVPFNSQYVELLIGIGGAFDRNRWSF